MAEPFLSDRNQRPGCFLTALGLALVVALLLVV